MVDGTERRIKHLVILPHYLPRLPQNFSLSTLVHRIFEASKKDWKAAAWLLARRHPQRWSEPKLTSLEETALQLAACGILSDDQLEALIQLSEASKNEIKELLSGGAGKISQPS